MGVQQTSTGIISKFTQPFGELAALYRAIWPKRYGLGEGETAPGFVPNIPGAESALDFLGTTDLDRFNITTEGFGRDLLGGEYGFDPQFGDLRDIERADIPEAAISPEDTAKFFEAAVGTPARYALEQYVLPGITEDYAGRGAAFGSRLGEARTSARKETEMGLASILGEGQLANQRLLAELTNLSARDEANLNVGSSRLLAQLGLQQERDRNVFGYNVSQQRFSQAAFGENLLSGIPGREFQAEQQRQALLGIPYQNQLGEAVARYSAFQAEQGLDARAFQTFLQSIPQPTDYYTPESDTFGDVLTGSLVGANIFETLDLGSIFK